ncbi:unnamed protein product [Prorocentrum cordatum]|uniref:Nucleolar protein 12 n=1 Tax=Prorocentrum cordatum TaxID=2364126 RepID=A0ABN9UKJ9_9DINO|nr:unnamed protein product [Polarella glacialis]
MGKKRKKPAGEDPGLVFDVAARQEFLLGFRKRKTARRKKAILEGIEAKRQDQIDVKRDLRNHIKDSWKQVQWADRHALKVIEAGSFGSRAKALMDREDGAGASGDGSSSEDDGSGEPGALEDRPRAASTVAFEREEDDPFGGCEVTVDGRDLCLLGAASASHRRATRPPVPRPWSAEVLQEPSRSSSETRRIGSGGRYVPGRRPLLRRRRRPSASRSGRSSRGG